MAKQGSIEHETPQPSKETRTNKRWYSVADLAEMFGVDEKTIWRWQHTGNLPKGTKLSPGCTRWPANLIDNWTSSRAQEAA